MQQKTQTLATTLSSVVVPNRPYKNLRRSNLRKLLREKYYCDSVMEEANNVVSNMINDYRSSGNTGVLQKELTDVLVISGFDSVKNRADSAEGNALISGYKNAGKIFVIKYNKSGHSFSVLREFCIGKLLTSLRTITPGFMYTFNMFECMANPNPIKGTNVTPCSGGTKSYHVLNEFIDGDTLSNYIARGDLSPNELGKIMLFIFMSLDLAEKTYGYVHFDLHSENIMLRKTKRQLSFDFSGVKVTTTLVPSIIDYGFSYFEYNGEVYHTLAGPINGDAHFFERKFFLADFFKFVVHSIGTSKAAGNYDSIYKPFFVNLVSGAIHLFNSNDQQLLNQFTNDSSMQSPFSYSYPFHSFRDDGSFIGEGIEDASGYLLNFQDKTRKGVTKCDVNLPKYLYGITPEGIEPVPCNSEQGENVDIYGTKRSFIDCLKFYFDGHFNVVEIPKGTVIYHGSPTLTYYNAEYPLGYEYYNWTSQNSLTAQEKQELMNDQNVVEILTRKQKINIGYYGDIETARAYSKPVNNLPGIGDFHCGENCISAYKLKKKMVLIDMSEAYNMFALVGDLSLKYQFLLAFHHGQRFSYQNRDIKKEDPSEEGRLLHIFDSLGRAPANQDDRDIRKMAESGIKSWMSRFRDLEDPTTGSVGREVLDYLDYTKRNPIKRFLFKNQQAYSMRFPKYLLPNKLISICEDFAYAGYFYPKTQRNEGYERFSEIVLGNRVKDFLSRDYNDINDWQYINDNYIFGEIGDLLVDLNNYETTNIDFHAGSVRDHSIWTALFIQWIFNNGHFSIDGYNTEENRILMVVTSLLHDIGKGGDGVKLFYSKPNHPETGYQYLERGTYLTINGTNVDLKQLVFNMGIPNNKFIYIKFLVRYHWEIGGYLSQCVNFDQACLESIYSKMMTIFTTESVTDPNMQAELFVLLLTLWCADLMASQPFIGKRNLKRLSKRVVKDPRNAAFYFNEVLQDFPFISNFPKTRRGRDMYAVFDMDRKAPQIKQYVLGRIANP